MIQPERLTRLFEELVSVDNSSLREREMCDRIQRELNELGVIAREDDAGGRIGGNCGNLYARIPGEKDLQPLLFSAHMDSVEPAGGKRAVHRPDGRITSDGTTVLGADCLAGVCALLEALRSLRESGKPHRPVEVLLDVAEEIYCAGIQQFDFSALSSRQAYILDLTGEIGTAALQAPSILSFRAVFTGRAAHAAFSPESGIHAIGAAARAVTAIPCGRIGDTTVNVGTVEGGSADNVVPERCTLTGEVRSLDEERAQRALEKVRTETERAAAEFGAAVEFTSQTLCRAYRVSEEEPVVRRFAAACDAIGAQPRLISTYGGSDNNHFFHHGLRGIVVACGMNRCHSCQEYTSVRDLTRAAHLVEALILSEE